MREIGKKEKNPLSLLLAVEKMFGWVLVVCDVVVVALDFFIFLLSSQKKK